MTSMMLRNSRTALTLDQIRQAAPSAFATEAFSGMSARYAYIPTVDVIRGMIDAGFQPFAAGQSRTRVDARREHTKHMIRFRAVSQAVSVGDIFPEIVLINSHDGSSAYKLMGGLFRLVCSNGLVIADSLIESLSVRHSGNVISEVASGSVQLVERMPAAIDAIERWKQIQLSSAAQGAFAEAAHVVRFADADGKINTPIKPAQLLTPRRSDDNGADLWTTFNRIQENATKGGLRARSVETRRRTSTRQVNGIDGDVRLNRALWTLGERMAELA
jgi:hypothetical protein